MKRRIVYTLIAMFAVWTLTGAALASTWFDTSQAALDAANNSPAMWEQRIMGNHVNDISVDTVIYFDYAGQTYTYYHVEDGINYGFFLPVVYSEQAQQESFTWDDPSSFSKGYWAAVDAMMDDYWAMRGTPELGDRALPDSAIAAGGALSLGGAVFARRKRKIGVRR